MFFSFRDVKIKRNGTLLVEDLNLEVNEGEAWWICGANGSGKTTFLEVISGHQRITGGKMILTENMPDEIFYSSVALIRRDFSPYHLFNSSASFYQQRFYSSGVKETPPVIDFIAEKTGASIEKIRSEALGFRISDLLYRHIVSLSTGEGRRVLLLMLWLTDKKILCFDDPYAGLDAEGQQLVTHALRTLLKKNITVFVTCAGTEPPDYISHVLFIKNKSAGYVGKRENFSATDQQAGLNSGKLSIDQHVPDNYDQSFRVVAEMNNITIKFDQNIVQKDFSWKILKGEKWMLTGPNGSGKSTLMSLIYGDNPMAYAYKLIVFDRVRGTGETIWDIKNPIGYFSSELQQFFPRSLTLYEAVLSGFSNHFVVRNNLTREHYLQADELVAAAGISAFRDLPLLRLSFSQLRIALVCRALVKLPPVAILDEPCQGLDSESTAIINKLVDIVCNDKWKTLIYVTHRKDRIPSIINHHLDIKKAQED